MANMTFKANLLPNSDLGYNLGSSTQQWVVYGNLKGNADSATKAEQDNNGNIFSNKYVTLDTGQTITGAKRFKSVFMIRDRWPYICFQPDKTTDDMGEFIWDGTDTSGNITNSRFVFRQYSYNSVASNLRIPYYEDFRIPSCTPNRTNNATYEILTTKDYNTYLTHDLTNTNQNIGLSAYGGKLLNDKINNISVRHDDTLTDGWHGLTVRHVYNNCFYELIISGVLDKNFNQYTTYAICNWSSLNGTGFPNYLETNEFNTSIPVRIYSNDTTYLYLDSVKGSFAQGQTIKCLFTWIT